MYSRERYRDLIEAADTITDMKNSANNVSFSPNFICRYSVSNVKGLIDDINSFNIDSAIVPYILSRSFTLS